MYLCICNCTRTRCRPLSSSQPTNSTGRAPPNTQLTKQVNRSSRRCWRMAAAAQSQSAREAMTNFSWSVGFSAARLAQRLRWLSPLSGHFTSMIM